MYGKELVNAVWSDDEEWNRPGIHPIKDRAPDVYTTVRQALMPLHEHMQRIEDTEIEPRFVDIGGGSSTHLYLPHSFLRHTTVLDGCDAFLASSRAGATLGCDVNEGIPLPDESVHAAISLFTVRYLFKERFMREVLRILKPGAPFFILDYEKLGHPLEEGPFLPKTLIENLSNIPSRYAIRQFHPIALKPELTNVWLIEGVK